MAAQRLTRKHVVVIVCISVALLHFVTGPRYRGPFRTFVNGYLIDVLLPLAMYLLLSLPGPPVALSRLARAGVVLGVGIGVETLQFFGVPIFGRTFDPLDFAMYGLGIFGGVLFESLVLSRLDSDRQDPRLRTAA